LEDFLPGFAAQSIFLCGVFVVDRQIFFDDGDVFLASHGPVFCRHQDGTEDGIIHILSTRISHPKHETRLGITPNLDSNGILVNNKFSSTRHPKYTIMIIIMVIRKLATRVTVALWDCLLTEYPKPHLTMDYGIPSNTTIRYYSREFANSSIEKSAGQ